MVLVLVAVVVVVYFSVTSFTYIWYQPMEDTVIDYLSYIVIHILAVPYYSFRDRMDKSVLIVIFITHTFNK